MFLNRAAEDIIGYRKDEVVSTHCTILDSDTCTVLTDEGKQKSCNIFKIGPLQNKKCRVRSSDGRAVYLLKNATVLKDAELVGRVADTVHGQLERDDARRAGPEFRFHAVVDEFRKKAVCGKQHDRGPVVTVEDAGDLGEIVSQEYLAPGEGPLIAGNGSMDCPHRKCLYQGENRQADHQCQQYEPCGCCGFPLSRNGARSSALKARPGSSTAPTNVHLPEKYLVS